MVSSYGAIAELIELGVNNCAPALISSRYGQYQTCQVVFSYFLAL